MPGSLNRLQANLDGSGIINRVTVYGASVYSTGVPALSYYEDIFTGNGTTQTFVLTHRPLYSVRRVLVGAQVIEVATIIQDTIGSTVTLPTAPAGGDRVSIIYWYSDVYNPITGTLTVVRDITDLIDPATGNPYPEPNMWFDFEITDTKLTTVAAATAAADAVLREFGVPVVIGTFITNKIGLEPGQQISIVDPVLGLNGTFTIRRVTTELDKAGTGVLATVQFGARPTKFSSLFVKNSASEIRVTTYTAGTPPPTTTTVREGPDISLLGNVIGAGGDSIVIYDAGGEPLAEYTTLSAALAAAASGDMVRIPAGTITGNYTLTAGVTVRGIGVQASILTGQITGAAGAALENLSITRTANDSSKLCAVVGPGSGNLTIRECDISATQSGAGTGYAVSVGLGNVYIYNSRAYGSTSMTDEA